MAVMLEFIRREALAVGLALALSMVTALPGASVSRAAADKENTIVLTTKYGRTIIKLRPDLAPEHVARIKKLTREKFYDGLKFHRVMEGFMAQTGDPRGNGTGGSKYPDLPAEFTQTPFKRGTLGMARSSDPNSANSQFFIVFARAEHLDGQYTVFGEIVSGMEFIDALRTGPASRDGVVDEPDVIETMRLANSAKK
ncbi:MAG: peptidylprolyl isomerase [Alphaproteobacteria bacterium]|nr:peptidylprolyl isomerase [Alphaproteobacteria bacterium]